MNASHETCFGYKIRAVDGGWSWVTFQLSGQVQDRGWAPNKALAAACVIRALARAETPEQALNAA